MVRERGSAAAERSWVPDPLRRRCGVRVLPQRRCAPRDGRAAGTVPQVRPHAPSGENQARPVRATAEAPAPERELGAEAARVVRLLGLHPLVDTVAQGKHGQTPGAVSAAGDRSHQPPSPRVTNPRTEEPDARRAGFRMRRDNGTSDHDVLASTGCRVAVVRRHSGTLAPTVAVASAVRQDSGAPRPAVHRRWPAAPLVPSVIMEQRAAPTARVSRTVRLSLRVSEPSPPRELHLGS